MNQEKKDYATILIGAGLLALGLFLIKEISNPKGVMLALPYICVGLGCGVFGHGMGNSISHKVMKKNPEIERQLNIKKNDERNIEIANRAKAKAFDLMTFIFGALMLSFALMGIELVATLLLVFVYLLVQGYAIYYRCKYDKEM